ncbi:DUF2269 family protein [Pseudomonas sp. KNUC1026]|uniref:DUF2269 family protein n=1 Tax=Pseudomonas sp. KNUC1026 TaxID=2893890 RepID=UPI001F23D5BD|nr:DUF2269 family protein [Pseudomonas sp. KNUC1026]UFH49578.1 DUF2269 domain-containing protein [Pseudomonas sp. KNUC1026]
MDTLITLKAFHIAATALLLASVAAVMWRSVSAWRAGDRRLFASSLDRPWYLAWVVMALCMVSFPVSGWWMVHTVGWPLGQTWLLGGACFYIVGALAWLWLLMRVRRLRAVPEGTEPSVRHQRWVAILAVLALLALVVLLVLMTAKPV